MLGGYKFLYVVSSTGSKKERNKEDQDQENRNDLRDPAMEQEERLHAVDEDLPLDDEDNEIMEIKKKEDLVPQGRGETIDEACTRKLISIGTDGTDETDETSKLSFTLMCLPYSEVVL